MRGGGRGGELLFGRRREERHVGELVLLLLRSGRRGKRARRRWIRVRGLQQRLLEERG